MISVGDHIVKGQKSKYRIVDAIEQSPVHSLFIGLEDEYNEQVAVQVFPAEVDNSGTFVIRFQQEARRLNSIKSESIPDIIDWGKDGEWLYVVLEPITGKSLTRYLREAEGNFVDEALLLQIAEQLLTALNSAHVNNILHQGLSPKNIFIDRNHQVKILDFGISRHIDVSSVSGGESITSIAYMAPENFTPTIKPDIRSDLYSVAVILYELATGALPYKSGNLVELLKSIQVAKPEPISKYRFDLSEKFVNVLNIALSKHPEKRFQTPLEMLRFIQEGSKKIFIEDDDEADQAFASSVLLLDQIIEDFPEDDRTQEIRKEVLEGQFENKSGWIFQLLSKSQDAVNKEEWELAKQLLDTILSFHPDHPQAKRLLEKIPNDSFKRASLIHADGTRVIIDKALITIGRNHDRELDLSVWDSNKYTSKLHAEIFIKNGQWNVRPSADSKNPTFVNEVKIPQGEEKVLQDEDTVAFADIKFIFSAT